MVTKTALTDLLILGGGQGEDTGQGLLGAVQDGFMGGCTFGNVGQRHEGQEGGSGAGVCAHRQHRAQGPVLKSWVKEDGQQIDSCSQALIALVSRVSWNEGLLPFH